jgi:hypothetical protein
LSDHQAIPVRGDPDFSTDMTRLIAAIELHLNAAPAQGPGRLPAGADGAESAPRV